MGYHKRTIIRGTYGELSKLTEELEEVKDAAEQGNKIMTLVELSDLLGAIKGYVENHHKGTTMGDLMIMMEATQRAFADGTRTPRSKLAIPKQGS